MESIPPETPMAIFLNPVFLRVDLMNGVILLVSFSGLIDRIVDFIRLKQFYYNILLSVCKST